MSDHPYRFFLAVLIVCSCATALHPPLGRAQSRPEQLLIAPLLLDPGDSTRAWPVSVRLRTFDLPDDRRAEIYTVGGWVPVGRSHAFAWELAYAGVESDEVLRYGGGAPRWQWTTRLHQTGAWRLAIDVAAVLPVGDRSLHPVAAKAPSVQARLRLSPAGGTRWRVWLGYWGQRVSPPQERDQPLSYFPSGSGVDVACVGSTDRLQWELWLHQQVGGLLDTTWVEADVDLFVFEDLALRLGAAANLGPDDRRQFDLGWTVGVTWRPRPVDEP